MSDFRPFAKDVATRYTAMTERELYVAGSGDAAWEAYLAAFPAGTDPIYKTQTEHTCTCCRNFIRNLGNVVTIYQGVVTTVWATAAKNEKLDYPYQIVAAAMDAFVKAQTIETIFRSAEVSYGAEATKQVLTGLDADGSGITGVKTWNHFYGKVAERHRSATPDAAKGDWRGGFQVFSRGLKELHATALTTVADLIKEKQLYRGEENLGAVNAFSKLHTAYQKAPSDLFILENAAAPAARFRNTAIGTLVQDLSEGVGIVAAVASFESKVAPENYKRTTALITPAMVKAAMADIEEAGLTDTLKRRLANISDVSVNDVLWVDNSVVSAMKDGVADLLMAAAKKSAKKSAKTKGEIEDIGIDDFMANVLPLTTTMEVLVSNAFLNNFVTLTAPVHANTSRLFKWDNDFAWAYGGNVTDGIKERVKRAGGNVTAPFRVSLSWFNADDLDIHVTEPSGNTINFGSKISPYGRLDVDMNAYGPKSLTPVENISWTNVRDGIYKVVINQYSRRDTSNVGFEVEIESNGVISNLKYERAVTGTVNAAVILVKDGAVVSISTDLSTTESSNDKWGVKTGDFVKVQTVMYSPNFWGANATGNKHVIFALDGCRCDESMRGIFNEFLAAGLEKHRKVFETLGDVTKCPVTADQISGLGFSSTRGDVVTVRAGNAKVTKTFNIKF